VGLLFEYLVAQEAAGSGAPAKAASAGKPKARSAKGRSRAAG
jgi:hypothetical protein